MRAIQIGRYGGPEVLDLVELPDPQAGPHQVLIDVDAADVLGGRAGELREQVLAAADWPGRFAAVEGFFARHIPALAPGRIDLSGPSTFDGFAAQRLGGTRRSGGVVTDRHDLGAGSGRKERRGETGRDSAGADDDARRDGDCDGSARQHGDRYAAARRHAHGHAT